MDGWIHTNPRLPSVVRAHARIHSFTQARRMALACKSGLPSRRPTAPQSLHAQWHARDGTNLAVVARADVALERLVEPPALVVEVACVATMHICP